MAVTHPSLEVVRLSATPVTADVALLELEGRLAGVIGRPATPRLVVEHDDARIELEAASWEVGREGAERPLRVTWALPTELASNGSRHALALGRTVLLDLPPPDFSDDGVTDAQVRFGRELNEVRRRLDE